MCRSRAHQARGPGRKAAGSSSVPSSLRQRASISAQRRPVALRLQDLRCVGSPAPAKIIARWPGSGRLLASSVAECGSSPCSVAATARARGWISAVFQRGQDADAARLRIRCRGLDQARARAGDDAAVPPFRANASINCRPVMSGRSRSSTDVPALLAYLVQRDPAVARGDDVRAGGLRSTLARPTRCVSYSSTTRWYRSWFACAAGVLCVGSILSSCIARLNQPGPTRSHDGCARSRLVWRGGKERPSL